MPQVGAISKAQIKSKGDPLKTKIQEKVAQCRNNRKGGPFTLIWFCRLRSKSKKPKGDPLETKKISKKSCTVPKKLKEGPFSPVQFCRLRLKSEKPFGIT